LVFQNTDQFLDVVRNKDRKRYKHTISTWRRDREIFPKEEMNVKDVHGQEVTVQFLHILQSANAIETNVECNDDEGIGNILQMREWNPTAAFACENVMYMRKLFKKSPK
jgi:hypothetical protein